MPRPIRTVLFDLDGTLLDSVRLILDSYHHTLATHGIPARTDDYWLAGLGTPLRVQFADWTDEPDLLQAMIATYRDFNITHHDARVRAYPGTVELVREIRRRRLLTGLVTSKQRPGADRGLRFLGLTDAIDVIVAADDVENPKPHPEPVLRALDQLGSEPGEAIYAGDSIHDMECGRAAGARTAAVLWGPFDRPHLEPTSPDYWLPRPDALLEILDASRNGHGEGGRAAIE